MLGLRYDRGMDDVGPIASDPDRIMKKFISDFYPLQDLIRRLRDENLIPHRAGWRAAVQMTGSMEEAVSHFLKVKNSSDFSLKVHRILVSCHIL